MTSIPANGAGQKGLFWISGAILAPVFLATFGLLLNTTVGNAQRVATLEAEFQAIKRELDGIAGKLDRLLERH
ncbi:MAG: hypothetical protein U0793_14830 [Gemmataceae bacterium]